MNKLKLIKLAIEKKLLSLRYLFGTNCYCKGMNKYLKHFGINLEGKPKFVARDAKFDSTDPSKITIGNGSVITSKVTILVHDYSIECGLVAINKQDPVYEAVSIRPVKIGNNCFIGQQAFIKPGTVIGDNCIIGAGSVVSGNIPENSIVTGNPAKVVAQTSEWANRKFENGYFVKGSKRRK